MTFYSGARRRADRTSAGLVIALAAAMILPASPGMGAPVGDVSVASFFAPSAWEPFTRVERTVHALRDSMEAGGYLRALDAVATAEGRALVATPPVPLPAPGVQRRLTGLDPEVRVAIAGLAAAVRKATRIAGPLTAARLDRILELMAERPRRNQRPSPTPPGLRSVAADARVAAALVTAAIDRYVPMLRAAASRPARSASVDGCDILDQLPVLCVGSEAANVYSESAALLVDLGGDDEYLNSAGGAPVKTLDGAAELPVSVNVDVAGNDTYAPNAPIDTPIVPVHFQVGSGAAINGVGVSVDLEGDDIYRAEGQASDGQTTHLLVQGAAFLGVGLLFDGAGRDSYEAIAPPSATGHINVRAQAASANSDGSLVLLVDRGTDPDTYSISSDSKRDTNLYGQAATLNGAAVLWDEGGDDAFEITATVRHAATPATLASGEFRFAQVFGQGRGSGTGGDLAALLTGSGDTRYTLQAIGDGVVLPTVSGQGTGSSANAATGVLDDIAGDDTYRLEADVSLTQAFEVDDSCSKCTSASMTVARPIFKGQVIGQGSGSSVSVLHDHSGADSYSTLVAGALDIALHDHLSAPAAPPVLQVESLGPPRLEAQGTADIGNVPIVGVLLDDEGTDSYDVRYSNTVRAEATSDHATGNPDVIADTYGGDYLAAQGAGDVGSLIDRGGKGDRFTASLVSTAETFPDPDGAFERTLWLPSFQGAKGGRFTALGEDVSVVSSPSLPVCTGARGVGDWTEFTGTSPVMSSDPVNTCSGGAPPGGYPLVNNKDGRGHVPGASGAAPGLAITGVTPPSVMLQPDPASNWLAGQRSRERLPVEVRLTDPSGAPLSGQVVHLFLNYQQCQVGSPTPAQCGAHAIAWRQDVTTDVNGVARGRLPLWGVAWLQQNALPEMRYNVAAIFDGDPALHLLPVSALHQFQAQVN